MAALVGLVVVAEGGVAAFDPAVGGLEDLVGEGGEPNRDLDRDRWLAGGKGGGAAAFPVRAGR